MYKGTKKQGPQFAFVMFFFKREKQIFYTSVINVKFLIAFLSSSGFKDPTFMLENVLRSSRPEVLYEKVFLEFCKIRKKTPVLEPLF